MICQVKRDSNNTIQEVLTSNGSLSKSYPLLAKEYGIEKGLLSYMLSYTDDFKNYVLGDDPYKEHIMNNQLLKYPDNNILDLSRAKKHSNKNLLESTVVNMGFIPDANYKDYSFDKMLDIASMSNEKVLVYDSLTDNNIYDSLEKIKLNADGEYEYKDIKSFVDNSYLNSRSTFADLDGIVPNTDYINSRNMGLSHEESLAVMRTPTTTHSDKLSSEDQDIIQNAREVVKNLFGANAPVIAGFNQLSKNLSEGSAPAGMFFDKIIYLNTSRHIPNTTVYHEAFHHVFRYLLTDKQAQYYLDKALAVISDNELQTRVNSLRSEYTAKDIPITELELRDLALEEYMADQYENYAFRNKPATNWLVALFRLIKNMFLSVMGNRPALESLYSKINNRGFRLRVRDNKTKSRMPVFKLLTTVIGSDKSQATADETQNVINTIAGLLINVYRAGKQESFSKTDVRKLLASRQAHYNKVAVIQGKTNAQLKARASRKASMYNPVTVSNDNVVNLDIVYDGVSSIFKALNIKVEDTLDEEENEAQEQMMSSEMFRFDSDATEHDPMDIADDMFKKYISTTLYDEVDDIYAGLGIPVTPEMIVQKPIDVDSVFKATLRSTASKDISDVEILNTIKALSYNNPQMEAFYKRLSEDISIQPNLTRLVFNAFNLEKINVAQLLTDPDHQSATIFDAITSKVEDPTMQSWEVNFAALEIEKKEDDELQDLRFSIDNIKAYFSGSVPVTSTPAKNSVTRDLLLDDVSADGIIKNIKDVLYNALGMDLHSNTVRYMILDAYYNTQYHNVFSQEDWNFYLVMRERVEKDLTPNENAKENPYSFTDSFVTYVNNSVLFDSSSLFTKLSAEEVSRNISVRDIRSPYKAKKSTEVVGRMRNLAKLNTLFDQTRVSISFQDAAGNMRYGFVAKSYLSSVFRWLKDESYRNELVKENPALDNNYLTRNQKVTMSDNFTPVMIGDIRQAPSVIMDSYGNVVKQLTFEEKQAVDDREGVTSKTLDFKAYSALIVALHSRRYMVDVPVSFGEETRNVQIEYALYHHQTNEVKNTDHALKLPTKLVVVRDKDVQLIDYITMDKNGKPILNTHNAIKDEFYKLFRQDLDGIYHETNKFINSFATYWKRANEYDPARIKQLHDSLAVLYSEKEFLDVNSENYANEVIIIDNAILDTKNQIALLEQELSEEDSFYREYHFSAGEDMKPVEDKDGKLKLGRAYKLWLYKDTVSKGTMDTYIKPFINAVEAYINKYYQGVRDNNLDDHKEELVRLEKDVDSKFAVFNSAEAKTAILNDMNKMLESEFKKFVKSLADDNLIEVTAISENNTIIKNLSLALASKIKEEEEDVSSRDKERVSLYEDYGVYSFEAQLRDLFYSDYMNNTSLRFLTDRNMKYRKDAVDGVKRAGSSQGSGKGGGNEILRFAVRQEPQAFTKAGVEVEHSDGGAEMPSTTFEYLMQRQGRMTKSVYDIFTKVHMGVPITLEEKEELEGINAIFSAQKTLLMDGTHLHKLAYMVVIPEFTSYVPEYNKQKAALLRDRITSIRNKQFELPLVNVDDATLAKNQAEHAKLGTELRELMYALESLYLAKPGYEQMHNTRQMMFYQDIAGVLPTSATKLRTRIPSQSVAMSEIPNDIVHDFSFSVESIEGKLFIMQLEVPSGKRYITNLSQLLNLIDNEQGDIDTIEFKGEQRTVADVKREFRELLGKRAELAVNEAIAELGSMQNGKFIPDLEQFRDKILKSVSASGGDETIMGFLKDLVDGNSKFKYNPNLAPIADKFQQLFLSHFSKGVLQQKIPGLKVSLLSGHGVVKVVDSNDRVIMDSEVIANRDKYFNADGTLKEGYNKRRLKWSMGRDATAQDISNIESLFGDEDTMMDAIASFLLKTKYRYSTHAKVKASLAEYYEYLTEDVKAFLISNAYINEGIEPRRSPGNSDDFIYSLDDFIYNAPTIDYVSMSEAERETIKNERMLVLVKMGQWLMTNNVITQDEWTEFYTKFDDENLVSDKFFMQFNDLLRDKRVPGRRISQSYAEIMMPATNEPQYAVQNGEEGSANFVNQEAFNEINTMLGARIPTQDKHSVIYARIVDFLPAAMGDVAIFPIESMWLSGEDFDIDAKYFMRKEFYVDRDGNIRIHGNAVDNQQEFEDYLEYMATFNNRVIYALEKYRDTQEYQDTMKGFEDRRNAIIETARLAAENKLDASKEAKDEFVRLLDIIVGVEERERIMTQVTDIESINTLAANLTEPVMAEFRNKLINTAGLLREVLSRDIAREEKGLEAGRFISSKLLDDLMLFDQLSFNRKALLEQKAEFEAKRDKPRAKKAIWEKKIEDVDAEIDNLSMKQDEILMELFDVMGAKKIDIKNNQVVRDEIGEEILALRAIARFHYEIRMEKKRNRKMAQLYKEKNTKKLYGMRDISQERREYINSLLPKILKQLGLPTDPNENFKELNIMATNNRILDLMMALYRNTSLAEINLHAASLTKIQGDRNDGTEFGVANAVSIALTGTPNRVIPNYTTSTGRIAAKRSNKVGSRNIGIVAIANIVKANLSRYKVKVKDSFLVTWDKTEIDNFDATVSNDIQFEDTSGPFDNDFTDVGITDFTREYRISDELATMLMAMTDNGKHGDADKLDWTFETFGVYCYLVSMGYGLNRVGLFSKQPIMSKYIAMSSGKTSAIVSKNDSAKNAGDVANTLADALEQRRQDLYKFIIDQDPEFVPQDNIGAGKLDSKEMLESMKTYRKFDYTSDSFLKPESYDFSKLFTDGEQLDSLKKLYNAIVISHSVVKHYNSLANGPAQSFQRVSAIIRLHQGLPKSFNDTKRILQSIKQFGADTLLKAKLGEQVEGDIETALDQASINIGELLKSYDRDNDTMKMIELLNKIIKTSENFVLDNTPTMSGIINAVDKSLRKSVTGRAQVIKNITSSLRSFTSIAALKQMYKKRGLSIPFDESLVYSHSDNTLLKQFNRLVKLLKASGVNNFKDTNSFLKELKMNSDVQVDNEFLQNTSNNSRVRANVDVVGFDTRRKRTSDYSNKLIDSYRELVAGSLQIEDKAKAKEVQDEIRAFATNLFYYLIAKDGLMFKNDSFIRYIAPEQYHELSGLLDKIQEAAVTDQWESSEEIEGLESLLGMNKNEFTDSFIFAYSTNASHLEPFRKLSLDIVPRESDGFSVSEFDSSKDALADLLRAVNTKDASIYASSSLKKAFETNTVLLQSIDKLANELETNLRANGLIVKKTGNVIDSFTVVLKQDEEFMKKYKDDFAGILKNHGYSMNDTVIIDGNEIKIVNLLYKFSGSVSYDIRKQILRKTGAIFRNDNDDFAVPRFFVINRSVTIVDQDREYTNNHSNTYLLSSAENVTYDADEFMMADRFEFKRVPTLKLSFSPYLYKADELRDVIISNLNSQKASIVNELNSFMLRANLTDWDQNLDTAMQYINDNKKTLADVKVAVLKTRVEEAKKQIGYINDMTKEVIASNFNSNVEVGGEAQQQVSIADRAKKYFYGEQSPRLTTTLPDELLNKVSKLQSSIFYTPTDAIEGLMVGESALVMQNDKVFKITNNGSISANDLTNHVRTINSTLNNLKEITSYINNNYFGEVPFAAKDNMIDINSPSRNLVYSVEELTEDSLPRAVQEGDVFTKSFDPAMTKIRKVLFDNGIFIPSSGIKSGEALREMRKIQFSLLNPLVLNQITDVFTLTDAFTRLRSNAGQLVDLSKSPNYGVNTIVTDGKSGAGKAAIEAGTKLSITVKGTADEGYKSNIDDTRLPKSSYDLVFSNGAYYLDVNDKEAEGVENAESIIGVIGSDARQEELPEMPLVMTEPFNRVVLDADDERIAEYHKLRDSEIKLFNYKDSNYLVTGFVEQDEVLTHNKPSRNKVSSDSVKVDPSNTTSLLSDDLAKFVDKHGTGTHSKSFSTAEFDKIVNTTTYHKNNRVTVLPVEGKPRTVSVIVEDIFEGYDYTPSSIVDMFKC